MLIYTLPEWNSTLHDFFIHGAVACAVIPLLMRTQSAWFAVTFLYCRLMIQPKIPLSGVFSLMQYHLFIRLSDLKLNPTARTHLFTRSEVSIHCQLGRDLRNIYMPNKFALLHKRLRVCLATSVLYGKTHHVHRRSNARDEFASTPGPSHVDTTQILLSFVMFNIYAFALTYLRSACGSRDWFQKSVWPTNQFAVHLWS